VEENSQDILWRHSPLFQHGVLGKRDGNGERGKHLLGRFLLFLFPNLSFILSFVSSEEHQELVHGNVRERKKEREREKQKYRCAADLLV